MTESTRPDVPVEQPVEPAAPGAAAEEAREAHRATALRWGAAALLLLLSGTATAVAMTAQARTDIPGLRTANDGRYVFPALTLPPLPSGRPVPSADKGNRRHYADLRGLLLPAPRGASDVSGPPSIPVPVSAGSSANSAPSVSSSPAASAGPAASTDPSASAATDAASVSASAGWAKCSEFTDRYRSPALPTAALDENACRAATKRVWTGPDGTRTEIWLLSFGSGTEAGSLYRDLGPSDLKGVPALTAAPGRIDAGTGTVPKLFATKETGSTGDPVGREVLFSDGDVFASIVMTDPKGVPLQAFQQVTLLQEAMLR
jgi:hypothetical protein